MKSLRRLSLLLVLSVTTGALACTSSSAETDGPDASPREDAGPGDDASPPVHDPGRLPAIGAIRGNRPSDGLLVTLCTGTLIGPHTLLTAAHCAQFVKGVDNLVSGNLFFAIGPDAGSPDKSVRIVSDRVAPLTTGGATNRGSDVAIFQLAEDVTDVAAVAVASAPIAEADIGTRLSFVGYGSKGRDETQQAPLPRRAGMVTLRALSGHPWRVAFPTLDALVDEVIANEGVPESSRAGLLVGWQPTWDAPSETLIPAYELHAGLGADDLQPCSLDSGGPLLRPSGDSFEIVAVHARTWVTPPNVPSIKCLLGGTYELVAPADIQDLVASSLADPCRGVTAGGLCSATTAIRCMEDAGKKGVTLTECGDLGKACEIDATGAVCAM